jgi:phospholipase/lecithinase/hemolysin
MNLKSFGCSFIFGNELADDGRWAVASQLTWPAHVARELNRTYTCHARAGSGNLQIMEQVLERAAESNQQDLFVIGWTWIDRFDYYDAADTHRARPWYTIMPIDETEVARTYYRHLHSEYRDKLTNLIYIQIAIHTLQNKGIPFVMTYMDSLLFDQTWHATAAVKDLQAQVLPHMTTFEGNNFLEWSRQRNYPVSDRWHPLEQAHEAAGKYIFQHKFN